jgi:hypothetical protein
MPAKNMVPARFEATVKDKIGDRCKDTEYEYGDGGELDSRLGVKRRTYRQADKKSIFGSAQYHYKPISSSLHQAVKVFRSLKRHNKEYGFIDDEEYGLFLTQELKE